MKAMIMVGIIGSGKTTMAIKLASENPNSVIINKDALRTMVAGKYDYCEKREPLISQITGHVIFESLYAGYDIIIDETNFIKSKRMALIKYLKDKFPKIIINAVVLPPGPWCLKRRLREARGVPSSKWTEVYENMMKKFEYPDKAEGFDNIQIMPEPDPNEEVVTPLLQQRSFCRENNLPYLIPGEICPECKIKLNDDTFMIENASSMHITNCPKCHYSFTN